jgi:probable HAF family extracellular repeat protein
MKIALPRAITCICAFAAGAAFAEPRFALVELPVLDGSAYLSVATGINETGDVSVYARRNSHVPTRYVALVCEVGRDKCKLLDHPVSGHHFGAGAYAINNAGVVAGYDSFRRDEMAAIWLDRHTPVGLEPDFVTFPRAYALNDDNVVVGRGQDAFGWQAQVWKEGVVTQIKGLGGRDVYARGINNAGIVAGSSLVANNVNVHAYTYDVATRKITDLGTIDGTGDSRAFGINSYGDITGSATVHTDSGDRLWPMSKMVGGVMKSLGMLGAGKSGEGLAINDAGDVVGSAETFPDDELSRHGFLYHEHVLYDLNDLIDRPEQYTVASGRGINGAGDIVGVATRTSDGKSVAVKLVKVQ